MKRIKTNEHLQGRLIDAQDGLLNDDELQQLKKDVMAHDASLWDDHLWMLRQRGKDGVLDYLQGLHTAEAEKAAISKFHRRREAEAGDEAALEQLVWSWFRRYVATAGMVLIVVLTGMEMSTSPASERFPDEQVEAFIGIQTDDMPELDHWLYEDL